MPVQVGNEALVTYSDVETSLGRTLTTAEQSQVALWIDDAELLVRTRLGDLSKLDQAVLIYVIREAVVNKVERKATGGASAVTVAVDDGNVTRRYENRVTAEDFLPSWWEWLSPDTTSQAFSTRPGFVPDTMAGYWPAS